ncbi:hypothetical protein NGA_0705300, partial [Nannochloropsis gaditana CCMP526]|uniref:uncharacterized protein n=1 Tax=Nannochloropsis gaditana (strain CCMP526) TaxID=1093141 RepID=UPI00029F6FDE
MLQFLNKAGANVHADEDEHGTEVREVGAALPPAPDSPLFGPEPPEARSWSRTLAPHGLPADILQVDLFATGPAGPGPAKMRGHGAEEEDEEEMDSYSVYEFDVSRVASVQIELEDGRLDRWFPCTVPATGDVLWGTFIHVAIWLGPGGGGPSRVSEQVGEGEGGEEGRQSRQISVEDEEDREKEGLKAKGGSGWGHGGHLAAGASPGGPRDGAEEGPLPCPRLPPPTSPPRPLRDQFGFPVAPHAQSEFLHLRSLEELRSQEQRRHWERLRCFQPSQRRRRPSAGKDQDKGGSTPPPVEISRWSSSFSSSSSSFSSSSYLWCPSRSACKPL